MGPVIASPGSAAGPKMRGPLELGSCFGGGTGVSPLGQTFPQLQQGGRSDLLSLSLCLTLGTGMLFGLYLNLHTCMGLSGARTFPRAMQSPPQSYCPRGLMGLKHHPLQILSLRTARIGGRGVGWGGQKSFKLSSRA